MKRYRDMTYAGGDSSKQAQAEPVMQTRFRLVHEAADGNEAVYEPYVVKTKRGEASWVACFKMEVAKSPQTSADGSAGETARVHLAPCACAAGRRQSRTFQRSLDHTTLPTQALKLHFCSAIPTPQRLQSRAYAHRLSDACSAVGTSFVTRQRISSGWAG